MHNVPGRLTILGSSRVFDDVGASMRDLEPEIEQIYRDDYISLCRVATAVTGRIDTAREVVQEAFALALAHRAEFRGEGSLQGWVARIVLRVALDTRRRPAPAPAVLDDVGGGALLWAPELPHGDRDPSLTAALGALPRRQRQVVFLRYFADLSHAKVAELLGISQGTVSALLHQARTTLAQRLACHDPLTEELQR
jgi:DNA-directed RNA polymerase specialized sigma24 family protein